MQPPSCTCPSVPCSHSGNLPDKKAACTQAPSISPLLSCVYKYPKSHCWLSCLELHIHAAADSTATKILSKCAYPQRRKPQLTGQTQDTGALPHLARTEICLLWQSVHFHFRKLKSAVAGQVAQLDLPPYPFLPTLL